MVVLVIFSFTLVVVPVAAKALNCYHYGTYYNVTGITLSSTFCQNQVIYRYGPYREDSALIPFPDKLQITNYSIHCCMFPVSYPSRCE